MKQSKTKKILLRLLAAAMMLSLTVAVIGAAGAADPPETTTIPSAIPPELAGAYPYAPDNVTVNGEYTIELLADVGYITVAKGSFGKYPQLWEIALPAGVSGDMTLRLTKQDGGLAFADSITVDGIAPSAETSYIEKKLEKNDFDVIEITDAGIELSYSGVTAGKIALTALIEPEKLTGGPFYLDAHHEGGEVTSVSALYAMDNPVSLAIDGVPDGLAPKDAFTVYETLPGSGHPDGNAYIWISHDDEYLYAAVEWTTDNTYDYGLDFFKVFAETDEGIKTFTQWSDRGDYGSSALTYTDLVEYEHMYYEIAIPIAELKRLHTSGGASGGIKLGFSLYGTGAVLGGLNFIESGDKWNLYTYDFDDGEYSFNKYTEHTDTWKVEGSTLTLNNFKFSDSSQGALIVGDGATIVLVGNNSIASTGTTETQRCGIWANGDLTIKGSGTLTVTSGNTTGTGASGTSYGIYATGNLSIIEGATVTATGGTTGGSPSYGIYLPNSSSNITITNSTVTATGGVATNNSIGIMVNGSVAITSSTVTATGDATVQWGYGLGLDTSMTIDTDSVLTATGRYYSIVVSEGGRYTVPNGISYTVATDTAGTEDVETGTSDGTFEVEGKHKYARLGYIQYPTTSVVPEPWKGGIDVVWTIGEADAGSFDKLLLVTAETEVEVEVGHADSANYEVKSGSTVITLKEGYLKTLGDGTHDFRAVFFTGYAEMTLTVDASANPSPSPTPTPPPNGGNGGSTTPRTGVPSNIALWAAILTASAIGGTAIAIALARRKKTTP